MSRLEHEIMSRNTLWNDNEGRLFMIWFCLRLLSQCCVTPVRMLEIGVDRGSVPLFLASWFRASNDYLRGLYVGVDPKWRLPFGLGELSDFASFVEADSEDFWKIDKSIWDLIYVDGCHDDDVAGFDVCEAVKRLRPDGILLVHDVRDDGGPRMAFIKHCMENPEMTAFFATAENVCGSGMGIAFRKGSKWE